ncbi:hypothetical protein [Candidatus Uabimicrobium sp. HlEnr_7]|uniref:hypothetical protein n=1 Tax=Candidatus Uabimicrobium helgolandensis TaxID=3095367 RepID=UPI0035581EAD
MYKDMAKEILELITALKSGEPSKIIKTMNENQAQGVSNDFRKKLLKYYLKDSWENEEELIYSWIKRAHIDNSVIKLIDLLQSIRDEQEQDIITELFGKLILFAVYNNEEIDFSKIKILKDEQIYEIFITVFSDMCSAKVNEDYFYNKASFSRMQIINLSDIFDLFKKSYSQSNKCEVLKEANDFQKKIREYRYCL